MKLKEEMNQELPDKEFPDPEYDKPDLNTGGIARLAAALSKAQGEIEDAHKDQQGFGYKYADLSQVLSIARPVLSKHGMAITQLLGGADEMVVITTILMHESGESIQTKSSMPVHIGKGMSHAQAVGAISTYLRRYSLSAIVGITQTDTDASSDKQAPKKAQKPDPTPKAQGVTARQRQKIDPEIVRALMSCEDIKTLQEMWAKIDSKPIYEGTKNLRKDQLEIAKADIDQAAI